jgi:hypothetical protein
MANNPAALDALLVKIDRAHKHILDFDAEFLRFLQDGNPYETFFADDPQTRERTYYLRVLREMPPQFSASIGDIAQNLRSALDHLAWYLVQSSPVTPKARDRDIYFPIFETAREYRAGKMGKIQGMTDAAIQAIDRIEPYYRADGVGIGQGAALFGLHEINKLDKHRLLVPTWTNMTAHTIPRTKRVEMAEVLRAAFGDQGGNVLMAANAATAGPLKDGSKLGTFPVSEVDDNMTFHFQIAFGEPKWVCGKEVKSTLANMFRIVRGIMIDFDKSGLL